MTTRRSFFRRVAAVVAAVALAPEIAFGVKLPVRPVMADMFRHDFEISACGTQVTGLYDFIIMEWNRAQAKTGQGFVKFPASTQTNIKANTLSQRELEAVFNG